MIIVFGAKKCKFCDQQKNFLKRTFQDKDWIYLDLLEDDDILEIAQELGVENIPSIIILDDKNKEIFRTSGKISPDKAFNILTGNNKIIPLKKDEIEKLKKTQDGRILLSYDPKLKSGENIIASSYCKTENIPIKINSCHFINIKTDTIIYQKEIEKYLDSGGRKDMAWVVSFKKVKGY